MEDFVSFELAKKLNEKGFNAEFKYSLGYYDTLGNFMSAADHWFLDSWIIAPTIAQVLKWLREKNNIHLYTDIDNEGWFFEIKCLKTGFMVNTNFFKRYSTYELAAIAGIEYVIDNLI